MNQSNAVDLLKNLPESQTTAQLQATFDALNINVDLQASPAAQIPDVYRRGLEEFNTRPFSEITTSQIRFLNELTIKLDQALELTPQVGDRGVPNVSEIDKLREWAQESTKGIEGKASPLSSVTGMQFSFATQVNDHTFTYRVVGPTTEQTQEAYIRGKLGDDAQTLIDGLKYISVDVSVKAPNLNEATLDTGSNRKTRAEQNRHYEGGLADPIQATNIAIEAICAAKNAGLDLKAINSESWEERGSRIKAQALAARLDEGTATVLEKLTAGVIRVGGGSGSGALRVYGDGRLFAGGYYGFSVPYIWAFGARPAPESKN